MASEEFPLPEGVIRPGIEPADQTRQLVNLAMMAQMITALEEGKLSLTLAVKSLKEQLEQQKKDQIDIYYYLNKKCDDSYEVIATLKEQLLSEQGDREIAEKQYEYKIEQFGISSEAELAKLKAIIAHQSEKLRGLDNFMEQKETLEEQLDSMKATLAKERDQNQKVLKQLDFDWTIEKDKLKKEYDKSLRELRAEMESKLESRINAKTRDIHIRNNEITEELIHQSKQADQVLIFNKVTLDKERQMRLDLELGASAEQEMLKKLSMYQRMIKELNEKLSTLDDINKKISTDNANLELSKQALLKDNNKLRALQEQSTDYRAGRVVTFVLRTHEALIKEQFDDELSSDQNGPKLENVAVGNSQEHENALMKIVLDVHQKFPAIFPCATNAASSNPITFFPPLSPKPSAGHANHAVGFTPKRQTRKAAFVSLVTSSTQTDEHREPLSSDTVWLTNSRQHAPNPDDFSEPLFQGGQWKGGSNSSSASINDNDSVAHISVKSASAIPQRPHGRSPHKYVGISAAVSLDGRRSSNKASVSPLKNSGMKKPLQVQGKSTKLAPRSDSASSGGRGEIYESKGMHHNSDNNPAYSPDSSVSMSPRLNPDDGSLPTLSPRLGDIDDATIDSQFLHNGDSAM